jgi:sugar/nucleoside kinase (ribokinase family)
MESPGKIDYLVVGHICRDLTPSGPVIGGTAAYSAAAARVLGCRTAVVTSFAAGDSWQEMLPDIAIHRVPSANTTTFENHYTPSGREQYVHAVAGEIGESDIPKQWRRAKIAHLGPVANEVDPEIITVFSSSIVGLTPQGWMRTWDESGKVEARLLESAKQLLPLSAATFVSDEDLFTSDVLDQFRAYSKILVMTQGAEGSTVFFGDERRSFAAPRVMAVDVTGAGDIFATAYLVRLYQTDGDPWEAARFATEFATQSVTAFGLQNKMNVLREYNAYASS